MTILIDSDVLIWLTRGHSGAAVRLRNLERWSISAVTYIEVAQGSRNKDELLRIKKGLAQHKTDIVPLTATISERAIELIDTYALSDGLQLADALIASTAIEHGMTLLSGNARHFNPVSGLLIERFVP